MQHRLTIKPALITNKTLAKCRVSNKHANKKLQNKIINKQNENIIETYA
jgi:hypothetical protein